MFFGLLQTEERKTVSRGGGRRCCIRKKGLHEEVKVKGKMEKTKQETTSKAVVPSKNALSRKAVVEFLKMLLSFLLFQSMGKTGEPKSEESAKLNYEQVKEDREDVPILQR